MRKRLKKEFIGLELTYSTNKETQAQLKSLFKIKKQLLAIQKKEDKLRKLKKEGVYIDKGVFNIYQVKTA